MAVLLLAAAAFLSLFPASLISVTVLGYQLSPFRVIVMVLAVYTICMWVGKRMALSRLGGNARFSIAFLVIWVAYAAMSIVWANDRSAWMQHMFFLSECLVLAIVMLSALKEVADFKIILVSIFAACVVQAIVGYYQMITHDYSLASSESVVQALTVRRRWSAIGISEGVNDISTKLVLGICAGISLFRLEQKRNKRRLITLCIAAMVFIVFIDGSRGCMYGTILIFSFLLAYSKSRFKWLGILAAILAGALILLFTQFFNLLEVDIGATSGSDYIRINLLKNGVDLVQSTFGFGVGAGQVDYMMAKYGHYFTYGIFQMHNMWFEVFVTFGLLIGLLFIVFYVLLVRDFLTYFTKEISNTIIKYGSEGLLLFLIAFAVACLALGSFITKEWLMFAFALCVAWQSAAGNICES